ncbi:uncharacterized protein LOC122499686 [Leptopilina heterotoma]|uniref:uncharacterized protein LOC122499686 n=1 Tax=Leptopilina heterotoma TaxID=63436 RepID=UPI001CA8C351|nr:uncharacterized protein LOC122499686 [Leptopilina heterotoma]
MSKKSLKEQYILKVKPPQLMNDNVIVESVKEQNLGRSSGPFCFKIQGSIYYQINTTLKPILGENPSYGQLFIIDPNEATEIRSNVNVHLDPEILRSLDRVLRDVNIFCQAYEMMGEEIRNQERLASDSNDKIPQLQLLFTLKPGMDKNRYNFQRTNEVAAVFSTTADGEIPDSYVVVCNKETKVLQKVSTMDPNVEPWVYPLFYPFGTRGWDKDIMRTTDKRPRRVTRSAYIKFRLAIRNNEFNTFNLGRRLFQQWVVDNYVKIEKDRTEYCKSNQTKLRVETYQGLFDFMQNTANSVDGRIGKMIVLPSTFIGSPRYMMQNYQDSMAIVRKFGKPDLFITMTCNPKWREIIENLLPDQVASDRPDISEIPDNNIEPELHKIIMRHNIHGPCREGLCIVNGKCSKKFPKPFQEETVINERGQVHYQRKDTNTTFVRTGGYEIDNRYVVPYNPFLSKRYNCHINVEVVGGGIESVKYLHKYMYKGHDSAAINISETSNEESIVNHDEIKNFIDGRYVGPVEACWRILNKPLQEKSHSVMRLPVHLPNEQNIFIESTEENALQEVMDSAVDQVTMLLDYFALNSRDEEARKYSYTNIPSNYVFKKTKINGAQSYGDLRTVDGITYDTFTAACLALGLIEDDEEWKKAMNEAILWMMPSSLRKLFVRILIHCQPTNPKNLWEEFKNAMSEDFSRYGCQQEAYKRAYSEINTLICAEGRRMSDFPEMEQIINEVTEIINSEINSENMSKGQEQYNKLNEKQKEFVDIILQVANNNVKDDVNFNNCFYIDGPGGSGKTFVYTTLYYLLKSKNKQFLFSMIHPQT